MARILIADDDEMMRGLLKAFLGRGGNELTITSSAEEALKAKGPFDLVVSDFNMGQGLNGVQFIKALRDRGEKMPAILISGGAADQQAATAGLNELENCSFLQKPFTVRQILDEVGRALPGQSKGI